MNMRLKNAHATVRFKLNGSAYFFVTFADPLGPFINFSNFTRDYKEVYKYIIDSWCSAIY